MNCDEAVEDTEKQYIFAHISSNFATSSVKAFYGHSNQTSSFIFFTCLLIHIQSTVSDYLIYTLLLHAIELFEGLKKANSMHFEMKKVHLTFFMLC